MTTAYFENLNKVLRDHERSIPMLLLDLDRLDQNIAILQKSIPPHTDFRVVVKSLPSPNLIQYVMAKADTKKLMVFHQPFLSDISRWGDEDLDILIGKPFPVKTAAYFYKDWTGNRGEAHNFKPSQQIQWLVDTEKRVLEYIDLAKKIGQKIRLNLEIDIGLHRGGFGDLDELTKVLNLIQNNEDVVTFSGFMGYDPHVVKLPKIVISPQSAFQKANDFYQKCIVLLKEKFPALDQSGLTFNGAGSPTIELHAQEKSVLNDISAGSCLVKPTSFDIPSLEKYVPAAFIATPILKKMKGTTLPALEKMTGLLSFLKSDFKQSYFIYGGYWKADYCYPKGTKENAIFGSSTNQSMINIPAHRSLEVDDFVFLRPQQSEFVFLQFGNILTVRDGNIEEIWDVLKNV